MAQSCSGPMALMYSCCEPDIWELVPGSNMELGTDPGIDSSDPGTDPGTGPDSRMERCLIGS